jgi:hypothetical protein
MIGQKSVSARLDLDRAQVQRSAGRAFYEGGTGDEKLAGGTNAVVGTTLRPAREQGREAKSHTRENHDRDCSISSR